MYMLNIDRYLPFLIDNKLTQQEYLFLHCLYFRRINQNKYDKYIEMYKEHFPTGDGSMIGEVAKKHLLTKGFIKKISNTDTADDWITTDKFNNLFINVFEAGNEIWDMYPHFVTSDEGVRYPLSLMDKNEFRNIYANRINYNRKEHEEVKKDLQYALDNKLIKGRIEMFVKSEQWEAFRKERLTEVAKVKTIVRNRKKF